MAHPCIVRCAFAVTLLRTNAANVACSTSNGRSGDALCRSEYPLDVAEETAAALIQLRHGAHASHRVVEQELDQLSYVAAVKQRDVQKVSSVVANLVEALGGVVLDKKGLLNFSAARSSDVPAEAFDVMVQEIRNVGNIEGGWLQLAPPEKGPVLWKMIRPDPWNCDLVVEGDPRFPTCQLKADSPEFNVEKLNCSKTDCKIDHANAYRATQTIGALPCCPTSPFCAAPACADHRPSVPSTCTKRTPKHNLAYLKHPDAWPAYHGWGGAFELDTLKLLDALAYHEGGNSNARPFDLMFDLGANTGYYTEKLTVRHVAKSYIMVEANPINTEILTGRWGNETWTKAWFSQQVSLKDSEQMPEFHIINQALSNHSNGVVDMCQTEFAMVQGTQGKCKVSIADMDTLILDKLSPEFKERFVEAQSAFIKVDTEGMDELVLRGMSRLLNETRGRYDDGSPRYLVNFFQFEFSPYLTQLAKERDGYQQYDIKTAVQFLESIGFETFLIGPRYLPLSHGSWDDEYMTFTSDHRNNAGAQVTYPNFDDRLCPWCRSGPLSFTSDIFAIRKSHPRSTELKVALGACQESVDFDITDGQYSLLRKHSA